MGTAFMQMISKPNRRHSTYRYESTPVKPQQSVGVQVKQEEEKQKQATPQINPYFLQDRCGITYKEQPTGEEIPIAAALVKMTNAAQDKGVYLSQIVFDRDTETKRPIFRLVSRIGEQVDLKVIMVGNHFNLQQLFAETHPIKDCDKAFLQQLYKSLFTNENIQPRIRVASVNKEGNHIVSYVCTDGRATRTVPKDCVLYYIKQGRVANATTVEQDGKINIRVTE